MIQKIETPDEAEIRTFGLSPKTLIVDDSRACKKGCLFGAIRGEHVDGASFIPQAIEKGACFILTSPRASTFYETRYPDVSFLASEDVRLSLAHLVYTLSPLPEHIFAVTGTNGKSSTTDFTRQLLQALGVQTGSIGTLGIVTAEEPAKGSDITTPTAPHLGHILRHFVEQKITHVPLEASSHGIALRRIDGLPIRAAAFTNLTHDHLDYHKTFEQYWRSKQRLFSELLQDGGTIVANAETPQFTELAAIAHRRKLRIIGYGMQKGDLHYAHWETMQGGFDLEIDVFGRRYRTSLAVIGQFQLANLLAAVSLLIADGFSPNRIIPHIPRLKPVPRRLECVATHAGSKIFIDFAHSPDALQRALTSLRVHTANKLLVLFGCGGDRDRTKRPVMGNVACRYADQVIVTDDNPRTEPASVIRREVMAGCNDRAREIAGRAQAIRFGIKNLSQGDVFLIAGKGFEGHKIVGRKKYPFNEEQIVNEFIRTLRASGH